MSANFLKIDKKSMLQTAAIVSVTTTWQQREITKPARANANCKTKQMQTYGNGCHLPVI